MTTPDPSTLDPAVIASAIALPAGAPDLLSADDPDWQAYQTDSPEYFLRVAGKALRTYCGWHITPNLQQTVANIPTGSRGLIMLPSRHVTQVDTLSIALGPTSINQIPTTDYTWHGAGWIQLNGYAFYNDWYMSGYYYGNDPYYLPVSQPGLATATFWHGYDALPENVKQVAFELAEQAMTIRSGNVKMLESPGGYRLQVSQEFGMMLNKGQMDRLATYRIGMVA